MEQAGRGDVLIRGGSYPGQRCDISAQWDRENRGIFDTCVVISILGLVCPAVAGAAPRPRADQSHPALSIPSKATGGGGGMQIKATG